MTNKLFDFSCVMYEHKQLAGMKNLQNLSKKIYDLTLKIKQEYPEIYQFLDEMPQTIPNEENHELDAKDYEDYLESLMEMVKKYKDSHRKA